MKLKVHIRPLATHFQYVQEASLLISILLLTVLVSGCKPKLPTRSANPSAYFKTPFQNESQFIVETIVSDLAEQMFYTKFHRLPDHKYFSVIATERAGTPLDTAEYELQVQMDSKHAVLKLELNLGSPIWSPAVYQSVSEDLAHAVGLDVASVDKSADTLLLSSLSDGLA